MLNDGLKIREINTKIFGRVLQASLHERVQNGMEILWCFCLNVCSEQITEH